MFVGGFPHGTVHVWGSEDSFGLLRQGSVVLCFLLGASWPLICPAFLASASQLSVGLLGLQICISVGFYVGSGESKLR